MVMNTVEIMTECGERPGQEMLVAAALARIQTETGAINGEERVQATDHAQKHTEELMHSLKLKQRQQDILS